MEVIERAGTLSLILRELPRRRVALVLLLVLANVIIVTVVRSHQIARSRGYVDGFVFNIACDYPEPFVMPWDWTAAEWRETFPWK